MPSFQRRWRAVLPLAVVAFSSLCSALACAQSCHTPALDGYAAEREPAPGLSVRTALAASFATFSNPRYAGEYQGLHPSLALDAPYGHAEFGLPVYRIVRNGLRDVGVGDAALDIRAPVVRAVSRGLRAGPELALTAPTGDAHKELGMGHTMLMPGAFFSLAQARLLLMAQLAYGRAVGGSSAAHAEHAGLRPLVNPMNLSEVSHSFGLSYALVDGLRAQGRVYGATPVANVAGRPREAVSLGFLLNVAIVDMVIELHLPLVGQPFSHKTVLGCAFRL
jgi:hypothetical protein